MFFAHGKVNQISVLAEGGHLVFDRFRRFRCCTLNALANLLQNLLFAIGKLSYVLIDCIDGFGLRLHTIFPDKKRVQPSYKHAVYGTHASVKLQRLDAICRTNHDYSIPANQLRRTEFGRIGNNESIECRHRRFPPPLPQDPAMKYIPLPPALLARIAWFASSLLAVLGSSPLLLAQQPSEYLQAGAATSNITPDLGGEIIGGFLPIPAQHIHDDLHARCLVLDDGETKIALVVCDLLGIHRSLSLEARRQIQEATGIPPENVLISATHTHSATSAISNASVVRSYQSDMPLNNYQKFVARRIADGVRRAVKNLQPAEIAFGRVDVPEHLFNRRWYLKEGSMPANPFGKIDKVKMNPPANSPDLVEPAGPIDPTLSFIALRAPGGNLISLYSAYSLHYVGDVGPGHISADYFAIYSERLKQHLSAASQDPPFVAMLANGTSGDINNIPFGKPRATRPTYGQMTYVAEDLANKVRDVVPSLQWQKKQKLTARYRELDLKWREVDGELMKWAQETAAKSTSLQGADLPAIYARRVMELAQASPETKAPVQLLVIGDIAIGCSPCETFAEIGIEFRKRSPYPNSFMVELAHGYYGYLPAPRHFELGGYETWPGTNYLEPQASVKIMDALLQMAAETK